MQPGPSSSDNPLSHSNQTFSLCTTFFTFKVFSSNRIVRKVKCTGRVHVLKNLESCDACERVLVRVSHSLCNITMFAFSVFPGCRAPVHGPRSVVDLLCTNF